MNSNTETDQSVNGERAIQQQTWTIACPECGESWEFACLTQEIARKVDAAMHWVENHEGPIPDDAPFGNHQCPECYAILGLNSTVSCSECGHIPEEVRA